MPDDFPTLEAVAAVAFAAGLLRALTLRSALAEVPRVTSELEGALSSADHARARTITQRIDSASFGPLAAAVVERAARGPATREQLRAVLDTALRKNARQSRRALASGGLSGLLLLGLLLFAIAARFGIGSANAPGTVFNVLVLSGVATVLANVLLGLKLLRSTRAAADRLLEAAASARSPERVSGSRHCGACGAERLLRLEPALPEALGPSELYGCPECGALSGRVDDPERLRHAQRRTE